MSAVQFIVPKLNLSKLIRMPGGRAVKDAVEAAQLNLEPLRPECAAELELQLVAAEQTLAGMGQEFDDEALLGLYRGAVRGIGLGERAQIRGVDTVLNSLCDLLDHLRSQRRFAREPVAVHLRAWRLLTTTSLPEESIRAVLDGLIKVSAHYGEAAPA
jgi:hypothetical protein